MSAVRMNQLSWIDDGAPIFLPVGALEQHGPHLPLGTAGLLSSATGSTAEKGAIMAGELARGMVVAVAQNLNAQPRLEDGRT